MSGANDPASGGRHSGRELALQVLYAIDLSRSRDAAPIEADASSGLAIDPAATSPDPALESPDATGEGAFERVLEHFVVPKSAVSFARELVEGVVARGDAIDEILGLHARNWRVSRMAAVDRNVLRLAIYELRDTPTPVAVVIDEAVDLARRFGSDASPAFVNGVLDAVARQVRAA